jgi:hypothetical protein
MLGSAVAFGALVWRNPLAFFRPEFWAEDGACFFREAILQGNSALFAPLGGYQNLISRIVAAVATLFSPAFTPVIYSTFAFVLSACLLGFFASSGFSWLVPSRWIRLGCVVLFVFAPGAGEVTAAICNLHTVMGLFACLLVLHEPLVFTPFKTGVWIALLLSCPELPLLLPLLAVLYWYERKPRYLFLIGSIVAMTAVNAVTSDQNNNGAYGLFASAWDMGVKVGLQRLALYLVEGPFLGTTVAQAIFKLQPGWFSLVTLAALSFFGAALWKAPLPKKKKTILLSLAAGIALYFFLVIGTRHYLWSAFAPGNAVLFWDSRYAFIAVCLAVIIWAALFSSAKGPLWSRIAMLLIAANIVCYSANSYPRPHLQYGTRLSDFGTQLKQLKEGTVNQATLPHFPVHPQLDFEITIDQKN